MHYIEGFVLAVPAANKDAYRDHAAAVHPLLKECGVARVVEAWGDDVPRGTLTDFWRAADAREDESIVFAWFEYPDRATRDAANARMRADPRMETLPSPPFDGKRMIFSGFKTVLDEGQGGTPGYVEGFVVPVPEDRRDAYVAMARAASGAFLDHGALRHVEAWGDDVIPGRQTDFFRAVAAREGETVVFSWIEWPDKVSRDAGMKAAMDDPRMQTPPADLPFDGKRMIYGGFATLIHA